LEGSVHRPVMVNAVLEFLGPRPGDVVLDGTCGGGGHAELLARAVGPEGFLIGVDRDEAALQEAERKLRGTGTPFKLFHADYRETGRLLAETGRDAVDGLLFDLGLSSDQLADPERGFSFAADGPLDMRYDMSGDEPTAADLLARSSERELADLFYAYGEERHSRRIAKRIVERRRQGAVRTARELADIVVGCIGRRRGRIHPATRVFQALRIAVNRELDSVECAARSFPEWLKPGGRAVFVAFHSLEDRLLKWAIREHGAAGKVEILTKHVVKPLDDEVRENPRARSARLRAVKRRSES